MEAQQTKTTPRKKGRKRRKAFHCHLCGLEPPFCWTCRCGFQICPECMEENMWGMTCNAITWACPDCGQQCQFGNQ